MTRRRAHPYGVVAIAALAVALIGAPTFADEGQSSCPVAGGPASAAQPVELCGTTTIETSTTGRARVRVPADATIDLSPAPPITGEGRIIGFHLTEPGTQAGFWARTIRYRNSLGLGVHTQSAGQEAEEDREPSSGPSEPGFGPGCSRCHIPPGDYDLYVIADGSPVTVTLELEGLEGERSLGGDDLAPTYVRFIDGLERSGTLEALGEERSDRVSCCDELDATALAFVQMATRVDTATVSRAVHTVCVRTAGAGECDRGFSTHQFVGTSGTDSLIGWRAWALEPGGHELSSSFEATNTLEGFTWQVDVAGVVLGIAPADAARAPRIFDIGGDANGLGAADVHRDTRPASWDPADLLLVRFETTYETVPVGDDGVRYEPTGLAIRFKTLASPDTFVDDFGVHFRLVTTIAGCPSYLLGTVYRDQQTGELTPHAYWDQRGAACPDGFGEHYASPRSPKWTATIDAERRELRLFYPFASLTEAQAEVLAVGSALAAPRAESHSPYLAIYDSGNDVRTEVSPVVDATVTGEDFVIGSDVPHDLPCTKGCP